MLNFLLGVISVILLSIGVAMFIEAVTPADYAIATFVVVMNIWNLAMLIGGVLD